MEKQEIRKYSDLGVKEAVVAGSFYPGDANILKDEINTYLIPALQEKKVGKVFGLISPHAGYIYSGPVAGFAYRQIMEEDYDGVVIFAPSHFESLNCVSFLNKKYYQTPLGLVPIAQEKISKLRGKKKWFYDEPAFYLREHSLEVQIPFLQMTLKKFSLLPLIIGNSSLELCRDLAQILFETFQKENILYIASSDLSHYHDYEEAKIKDLNTINLIKDLDTSALIAEIDGGKAELCGLGPVLTLMELFKKKGGKEGCLLKYANSGDTAGSKDKVVGYAAMGFIL